MFIANAQSQQVIDWVESLRASISRMACQISDELTIRITASFGIAYCPDSHAMLRGGLNARMQRCIKQRLRGVIAWSCKVISAACA
jgi:RNase P subunit RPR2